MLGFRKETIERFIWYVLGLNLIAVAVVLNIRYVMGVAAFSSVMYAISQIYHISLGTASILCYLLFVLIQCVLSRKIKAVYLLEIPLSLAFGVVTDVYDWLIPEFHFPAYISMTLFLLTMFVTALGVFLCVKTNFVLTPTEGIVQTISEVFHIAFSAVKNTFDVSLVLISTLLCLFHHTELYGIGVGTVLSALCIGRIIGIYEKMFRWRKLNQLKQLRRSRYAAC